MLQLVRCTCKRAAALADGYEDSANVHDVTSGLYANLVVTFSDCFFVSFLLLAAFACRCLLTLVLFPLKGGPKGPN